MKERPAITRTVHKLPFENLSPEDFERLCFWLVDDKGYENAEHLGAAGQDSGRDILAWKDGKRVAFQCKRVRQFGPKNAESEIKKLLCLPVSRQPDDIVFLVTTSVSEKTRELARSYWGDRGDCLFWSSTELDKMVNSNKSIVNQFFGSQLSLRADFGSNECPFPGLASFDESFSPHFFGRSNELEELLRILRRQTPKRTTKWLHLEGPSGYGKSSLLKAGLIPAFREGKVAKECQEWVVLDVRPGIDPIDNLTRELLSSEALDTSLTYEEIKNLLLGHPGALVQITQDIGRSRAGLLLVVDQLEEVFTITPSETERAAALDTLLANLLAEQGGHRCLVTSMRSDFFGNFYRLPKLESMLNSHAIRYYLEPMTEEAILEAIERPIAQQNLRWETIDLPRMIAAEAIEHGHGMQVVAHLLRELWMRDYPGGILTHATLNQLGGVSGAISHSAERLLRELGPEGKAVSREIFLSLVKVGRGTADVRRVVSRQEVLAATGNHSEAETILAQLSGSRAYEHLDTAATTRLIVVGDHDQVELVHENLIRAWPTLSWWIDEYRDQLRVRDDLEDAARAWRAAGEPREGLPRGAQLTYFRRARGTGALASRFLGQAEDLEKIERYERSNSRRLILAGGLFVMILIVSAVGYSYANRFEIALGISTSFFEELEGMVEEQPRRVLDSTGFLEFLSFALVGKQPGDLDHRQLLARLKLLRGEAYYYLPSYLDARNSFLEAVSLANNLEEAVQVEIKTLAALGQARTLLADPAFLNEEKRIGISNLLEGIDSRILGVAGKSAGRPKLITELTLLGQDTCSAGFYEVCATILGQALAMVRSSGLHQAGYCTLDKELSLRLARKLFTIGWSADSQRVLDEALKVHGFPEWLGQGADGDCAADQSWFLRTHRLLIDVSIFQGDFISAISYGKTALRIIEASSDHQGQGDLATEQVEVLIKLSFAELGRSDPPAALRFALQAADVSKALVGEYSMSPILIDLYFSVLERVLVCLQAADGLEAGPRAEIDSHIANASRVYQGFPVAMRLLSTYHFPLLIENLEQTSM